MTIDKIRLTQMTKSSGWAAKIGPETLAQVLCKLPKIKNENLLVGFEMSDDAAIYKVNDELALIQTVDFFTPVVDDPYLFGQIAAANSLSDVYAMGGEPKLALNIIGFPSCLENNVMTEILKGGLDKVIEAGATLAGGHSIEDDEPKYGLCVTGFVDPNKIFKNQGAKPGDILILTKPLGLGIINTAIKAGLATENAYKKAVKTMTLLNKNAKDACNDVEISSCTDITGFGLIGHSFEMAENSNVSFQIFIDKVPIIEESLEYAEMGLVPAGAYKNKEYFGDSINMESVPEHLQDILFDPQTSGGLLIALNETNKAKILENLNKLQPEVEFAVIGKVIKEEEKRIILS